MHALWSQPRARKVLLASVGFWLLFGWVYGDDPLWTVVRAVAATVTIALIVGSYASESTAVRSGRIAVATALGGACAYLLGASAATIAATAGVVGAFLAGCEYLIWRDSRDQAR